MTSHAREEHNSIGLRAHTRTRHEMNADPRTHFLRDQRLTTSRGAGHRHTALRSHRRRYRTALTAGSARRCHCHPPLPPRSCAAVPMSPSPPVHLQGRGTGGWAGGYEGEVEGRRLGGGRRVLRRGNGNGVSSRACRRRLRLPACLPTALTTASRRSSAGTAVHLASRTWREATR